MIRFVISYNTGEGANQYSAKGAPTAKPKLRKIPVGSSSQSSAITARKLYRVKIDGSWYEGRFSKQSFGWNFENYGTSGMQLNLIDTVYEIQLPPPKRRPRKQEPPK